MIETFTYTPIGLIRSPFKEPDGTPIQPAAALGVAGTIEIFPEYSEGLWDIEGFSHLILVYHFHRARPASLTVVPFLDDRRHGIFATRAPARPNPLGLSIVSLIQVEGNVLHIQDVDIIDKTPLLDIKPYVPAFDIRNVERIGWLENNIDHLHRAADDGRFSSGEKWNNRR